MKRMFLLAAATALIAANAVAAPGAWLTNIDAAQKKAKQKHQLIFVDLFADWCGWCHKFEREVIPSQAFQNATDDMVLLRLNTEDGKDGTAAARDYGVSSLPTFLVLTEDGMIAGQIRGYAAPNDFHKAMDDISAKYAAFKKRADDEPSYAKDYQKRLDLAKEFIQRHGFAQSEARLKKLVDEQGMPVGVRDDAYYSLALAQFFGKRYDDASKTLKKFASIQNKGESYEKSRLLVGDIYLQQGNLLAAAKEYRSFKSSFPNSPYVRNVELVLPQIERQLASGKH